MSRSLDDPQDFKNSQPLGTTSARLVAVRLKSANKNIFRALLSLASANLLIRVMGLLNTIVITARFGFERMDPYFVATTLPVLLGQLLSSSLEASVIPVYSKIRTKGTKQQASDLFSTLLNLLILCAIALTAVMLVFREPLLHLSAPGSKPESLAATLSLAPLVFPILIFTILNSFMECLLNAEGKFGWPAYAGMLVPLTTVVVVLISAQDGPFGGLYALGMGTMAGNALQLLVIAIRARMARIEYRFVMKLSTQEMKDIFKAASPALAGGLITIASPLVDQIFASLQTAGTITALNNAQKLNSVPTGVIFSAAGRAALPFLAQQAAIRDMKSFKGTLRLYLWGVTIVTFFVALVMGGGSKILIILLLRHGNVTAHDTDLAAIVLTGLALGLVPMAVGFIVSRAFSALGKTRVLFWVSTTSVFLNAAFDYFFGITLHWGAFGIAFATSVYYLCTMIILLITLRRTIGPLNLLTPPQELLSLLFKLRLGQLYVSWVGWREDYLTFEGIGVHAFIKYVTRTIFAFLVFAGGVFGAITNGLLTLRIAFGSILVILFLRYPFFLLLTWAGIDVFIGSSIPFLAGSNLLSGLVLPTLLLLFYLPTRKAFKRMPPLGFLLTYLIWVLFSVGFSPITVYDFFVSWTGTMAFIGVAVIAIVTVDSRKRLLLLIDMMLLPAVYIAGYGIWGYFTKHGGLVDTTTGLFRISSIFGNTPPTLAIYLSITIPLTVYRLTTLKGKNIIYGLILLTMLLTALVFTYDRGTLLALPASAVMIWLFAPTKTAKNTIFLSFVGLGVAVGAAIIILKLPILSRFGNSDLTTLNGRTQLWQAILDHFDPTNLLGYGHKGSDVLLGNLKVGFAGGVIATVAHNIFLESMYEHGLIGVTMLVLFLLSIAVSLINNWFTSLDADQRMLTATAIWSFTAVAIKGVESNDIWNGAIGIYFMMFMALPFVMYWTRKKERPEIDNKLAGLDTNRMPAIPKTNEDRQLSYV